MLMLCEKCSRRYLESDLFFKYNKNMFSDPLSKWFKKCYNYEKKNLLDVTNKINVLWMCLKYLTKY